MPRKPQVDGPRERALAHGGTARLGVSQQHEAERPAAVQVGRPQDQLAEARLAQVLGEEGDVAASQLGALRPIAE